MVIADLLQTFRLYLKYYFQSKVGNLHMLLTLLTHIRHVPLIGTLNSSFCNKSHIFGTYIYTVNYLLLSITIYCLLYMFFLPLFLVTFVPKGKVESLNKNKAFQLTRVSFGTKIGDKGR